MSDKILRDMWNSVNEETFYEEYNQSSIEKMLNQRAKSIESKIIRTIQFDTIYKIGIALGLLIVIRLYLYTPAVLWFSIPILMLLFLLIIYEKRITKRMIELSNNQNSTQEKLSDLLHFLSTKFEFTIWAIASSQLFLFSTGVLIYFHLKYGHLKQMDTFDYFVFGMFYLIGFVTSYMTNKSQINYHTKHINTCLSDLNKDALYQLSSIIERNRKQDKKFKGILGLLIIFGFTLFIILFKLASES